MKLGMMRWSGWSDDSRGYPAKAVDAGLVVELWGPTRWREGGVW